MASNPQAESFQGVVDWFKELNETLDNWSVKPPDIEAKRERAKEHRNKLTVIYKLAGDSQKQLAKRWNELNTQLGKVQPTVGPITPVPPKTTATHKDIHTLTHPPNEPRPQKRKKSENLEGPLLRTIQRRSKKRRTSRSVSLNYDKDDDSHSNEDSEDEDDDFPDSDGAHKQPSTSDLVGVTASLEHSSLEGDALPNDSNREVYHRRLIRIQKRFRHALDLTQGAAALVTEAEAAHRMLQDEIESLIDDLHW